MLISVLRMSVAKGAWLSLKLTHSSEILDPGFLSCTSYEKNTLIRHVQFTREKNYSREEPQNVHLGFFSLTSNAKSRQPECEAILTAGR